MPSTQSQIVVRPSAERGNAQIEWLKSYHSFSFGEYYDPAHSGFRSLLVINEDFVKGGGGFGKHPHKDMEIVTYVLSGNLQHEDSMGNGSVIKAGDVQKMSAGSGIFHSEYNASKKKDVHSLQIWILPEKRGIMPAYEQFSLPKIQEPFHLFASPAGGKDVITMRQDAKIYRGILKKKESTSYSLDSKRGAWVQVIKGEVTLNSQLLKTGDGASVENLPQLNFTAEEISEFLLFDLK